MKSTFALIASLTLSLPAIAKAEGTWKFHQDNGSVTTTQIISNQEFSFEAGMWYCEVGEGKISHDFGLMIGRAIACVTKAGQAQTGVFTLVLGTTTIDKVRVNGSDIWLTWEP